MKTPTWKNTLCRYISCSMEGLQGEAKKLGYLYFEWNGRVLLVDSSGMHMVGKSCDFPLCMSEELDQCGSAIQWHRGLRPVLKDIKLMAFNTLPKGMLLDLVSGHIANALMAIVWPDTGKPAPAIESVLLALDDYGLRGQDPDGSIASAVAALRARIVEALRLILDKPQ